MGNIGLYAQKISCDLRANRHTDTHTAILRTAIKWERHCLCVCRSLVQWSVDNRRSKQADQFAGMDLLVAETGASCHLSPPSTSASPRIVHLWVNRSINQSISQAFICLEKKLEINMYRYNRNQEEQHCYPNWNVGQCPTWWSPCRI